MMVSNERHLAEWWQADGKVAACALCPHQCRIAPGRTGRCGVRRNVGGQLLALTYGRPAAIQVDPIEKKPLYHFLPGSLTYSLGTVGCNLSCQFCQNYELSTETLEVTDAVSGPEISPAQIVAAARREQCASVALTYNEPTVWAEYGRDLAVAAHGGDLKVVSVTNGFIQPGAAAALYEHVDAANVDLKAFDDDFYQRLCGGRLQPVLDTLKQLKRRGVWLEVTNLVIPGENDAPTGLRALCRWVASELGPNTPLHFSAFFPTHRLTKHPVTPHATLTLAARVAAEAGLTQVHLGNLHLV
ncbi:MAG: AmmeMemoRadiSam system radical SAM enzyme [bacterium]